MLWEPCLETYFLGTCFLGTLLGNLFLGTLLGNLAPEPVLGNPFLGTRSWEPVLGNLAWEPCSWEPGNFGNPDFGSSDLLRDLDYGWRHQAYSTLLGEKIDQSFIFNLIYGNLNADIIAFAASLFLMGITLLLCFLLEQCSSAKNDAGNSQVSWSSRGGHCPPPLIASNLSHLGSQLLSHWEAKMTSFCHRLCTDEALNFTLLSYYRLKADVYLLGQELHVSCRRVKGDNNFSSSTKMLWNLRFKTSLSGAGLHSLRRSKCWAYALSVIVLSGAISILLAPSRMSWRLDLYTFFSLGSLARSW